MKIAAHQTLAGRENKKRERLWFSPACITPEQERTLFDGL